MKKKSLAVNAILNALRNGLNILFPINIPIIIIAVLVSAYILHILAGVISQIFDSKPFEVKALLLQKK